MNISFILNKLNSEQNQATLSMWLRALLWAELKKRKKKKGSSNEICGYVEHVLYQSRKQF